MPPENGILIIDETGFSRICSAILEREGYVTKAATTRHALVSALSSDDVGLAIISYPFGAFFCGEIKKKRIPALILSDHINRDLIDLLEGFEDSYSCCMIKPLDYRKFRRVVKEVITDETAVHAGYSIV